MNNNKVRIYDLSKELNLENKDILSICEGLEIAVKSHSSTISESEAAKIRAAAATYVAAPAPARKHPVVRESIGRQYPK
jgi:translation initiation factor IF-2